MYSILIRDATNASLWSFYVEDEQVYKDTKANAQAKVTELLATVTLNRIKVVHNTTLTGSFTITDVEAE